MQITLLAWCQMTLKYGVRGDFLLRKTGIEGSDVCNLSVGVFFKIFLGFFFLIEILCNKEERSILTDNFEKV